MAGLTGAMDSLLEERISFILNNAAYGAASVELQILHHQVMSQLERATGDFFKAAQGANQAVFHEVESNPRYRDLYRVIQLVTKDDMEIPKSDITNIDLAEAITGASYLPNRSRRGLALFLYFGRNIIEDINRPGNLPDNADTSKYFPIGNKKSKDPRIAYRYRGRNLNLLRGEPLFSLLERLSGPFLTDYTIITKNTNPMSNQNPHMPDYTISCVDKDAEFRIDVKLFRDGVYVWVPPVLHNEKLPHSIVSQMFKEIKDYFNAPAESAKPGGSKLNPSAP